MLLLHKSHLVHCCMVQAVATRHNSRATPHSKGTPHNSRATHLSRGTRPRQVTRPNRATLLSSLHQDMQQVSQPPGAVAQEMHTALYRGVVYAVCRNLCHLQPVWCNGRSFVQALQCIAAQRHPCPSCVLVTAMLYMLCCFF